MIWGSNKLAARLSATTGRSEAACRREVKELSDFLINELLDHNEVVLPGIGRLYLKRTNPRAYNSPLKGAGYSTGKWKVKFTVMKGLADTVGER